MSKQVTNSREEGSSLLIVLWVVMAGALLVTSFNSSVQSNTNLLSTELAMTRHRALFETGLTLTAANLLSKSEDIRWKQDGTPRKLRFEGVNYTIRIFDENGKIDLNYADPKMLTRLLVQLTGSPSEATSLRQAIVAQRPRPKKLGDTYRRTGFAYPSQARSVAGMSAATYRKLVPLVTVFSSTPKINPMTAPREVLLSVPGLHANDAERIVALRKDGEANLMADGSIKERFSEWMTVINGPTYTVQITIDEGRGLAPMTSSATILLRAKDKLPFRVLAWNVL